MKKLFTTLAFCAGITMGAFAQHCGSSYMVTTSASPHPSTGVAGLTPVSDSLTPAVNGTYISDTIYFENYTTESGVQVNSLKIDEINNLPNGLCWETNVSNNTFAGGATGVIVVSGTPYDSAGQYKLVIIIDINTSATGTLDSQNAEALTGTLSSSPLRYYVRVNCPGGTTQPIDTNRETALDSTFFAYSDQTGCIDYPLGTKQINALSDLTIMPNPFSGQAKIVFNSTVAGTYSMKMMDLTGQVVSSQDVNIQVGQNNLIQNRNGLSPGIYLMSLSIGENAITRKVTIE